MNNNNYDYIIVKMGAKSTEGPLVYLPDDGLEAAMKLLGQHGFELYTLIMGHEEGITEEDYMRITGGTLEEFNEGFDELVDNGFLVEEDGKWMLSPTPQEDFKAKEEEIPDVFEVVIHKTYEDDYTLIPDDELKTAAKLLGGNGFKLYTLVMSYKGKKVITDEDVAEMTGMTKEEIDEAFDELVEHGFYYKDEKGKWVLNPNPAGR